MELDRTSAIAFLIAVIGALFAVLTYIQHSTGLGMFGLATMGWLWWICGRSETEM